MMNVREIVLSMSMPMSAAVGASSETARMLRPSLVTFTSRSSTIIMAIAVPMMITWIIRTGAPSMVKSCLFWLK